MLSRRPNVGVCALCDLGRRCTTMSQGRQVSRSVEAKTEAAGGCKSLATGDFSSGSVCILRGNQKGFCELIFPDREDLAIFERFLELSPSAPRLLMDDPTTSQCWSPSAWGELGCECPARMEAVNAPSMLSADRPDHVIPDGDGESRLSGGEVEALSRGRALPKSPAARSGLDAGPDIGLDA
jgi:hypothetical protein